MSTPWKSQSRAFFKALGAHVTQVRRSIGMTQAELARAIGCSQQAVFAYELGTRRISVIVLIKLANVFNMGMEDLARLKKPPKVPNRRLSPRAARHAQRLMNLSKTQQRFVIRIIDVLELSGGRWIVTQYNRRAA